MPASEYHYDGDSVNHHHRYLLPPLERILQQQRRQIDLPRLFDLGCGTGEVAARLARSGWEVTGVDVSESGIAVGRKKYPEVRLEVGSVYDDLCDTYGSFPVVVSLEVVEHLYAPREFAKQLFRLVEPGGLALVSTPYHGYWKNLLLALTGKLDAHFGPLWDHGHIKFWSAATLTQLLEEAGFTVQHIHRVGRVGALAKSMIAVARRPQAANDPSRSP